MKTSRVLRLAAKHIEKYERCTGGCAAIEQILWDRSDKTGYARIVPQWEEALAYLRRMAPKGVTMGSYWFGKPYDEQDVRILALCFAAVLAEEDGK